MNKKIENHTILGNIETPPDFLWINQLAMIANTEIAPHSHTWGQLNIINQGVMEVGFRDRDTIIAPWQYGIWIPAGIEHSSFNKKTLNYCSISIRHDRAQSLPAEPCMLELSNIVRAIIDDFIARGLHLLDDPKDRNLANVVIEQLTLSHPLSDFLPTTGDKYLKPILDFLQQNPGDNKTLAQWASEVYTTERTLARRCQLLLNLSFREWKQRLRFLRALSLLKTNLSIQEIAFMLGYNNPSNFIQMFKKFSGSTPEKYRRKPESLSGYY